MDYELKYVIAICLIVKIAALSPEFSINEETEKLEQNPTRAREPLLPYSAAEKTFTTSAEQRNRQTFFTWGSGREKFNEMNNKKGVGKTQKIIENQSFDTCEHKLKLLQSSLKWRDIRKTLHWLGRIIASNQTNFRLCPTGRNLRQPLLDSYHPSKTEFRKFFKRKKIILARNYLKQNQKSKKEHKHWKHHSRKEKYKTKHLVYPALNTTILKPNSVLFDFEKIFVKNSKTSQKCKDLNSYVKNCKQTHQESKNHTEISSPDAKVRENKTKSPKPKPWPHFVYHRVSSNFLHPELTGQSNGKSAYIAISVVNGGNSGKSYIASGKKVIISSLHIKASNIKLQRQLHNIPGTKTLYT